MNWWFVWVVVDDKLPWLSCEYMYVNSALIWCFIWCWMFLINDEHCWWIRCCFDALMMLKLCLMFAIDAIWWIHVRMYYNSWKILFWWILGVKPVGIRNYSYKDGQKLTFTVLIITFDPYIWLTRGSKRCKADLIYFNLKINSIPDFQLFYVLVCVLCVLTYVIL